MIRPLASSDLTRGSVVGDRFTVHGVIGVGGTATVYLADDARAGRSCALKVLSPALAARPKVRERFAREVAAMAALDHPSVLRVLAWGDSDVGPYLAAEYAARGTIGAHVASGGPLEPAHAVSVALQTCGGLAAAHARGIVHRDVKPDNILVMADGSCRVGDFGIARVETHRERITRTGTQLGTAGFMAPEQMAADAVDHRADVYGVAATLWYLLCGVVPAHAFAEDPWRAGVPGPLVPILARATSFRTWDRHADVAELMSDLRGVLSRLPPLPEAAEPLGALPPRPVVDSDDIGPIPASPTWCED